MKILSAYCFILFTVLISAVSAEIPDAPDDSVWNRFSGRIEAGAFFVNSDSQIYANDESGADKQIDDLGKSESSQSFASSLVLFDLNYDLNEDTILYFGTPFFMDNREGLSFGAERLLNNGGLLDIALFANSTEVWKDPYLIGEERELTYSHKAGINFLASDIYGTGFIFNYIAAVHTVEDDISGKENPDLERQGLTQKFKPGYTFYLNQDLTSALTTTLLYERNDSDGNAYTYNKVGGELSFAYEKKNTGFELSASADSLLFSNRNPVFDKKIEATEYSFSVIISQSHLWDTNWYCRLGTGVDYLDANADFFDHTIFLSGITIGYSFE